MGSHSEFPSSDRRFGGLDEARRTMWLWAEPIIIDRAVEIYVQAVDEAGTVVMARNHCRLWRNVLLGPPAAMPSIMEELRRAARSFDLPVVVIEDVNDAILEELVDIVTSRYRSSRNTIKTFSMVLMAATSCLGTARAAA